jgi:hypothetical protein
MGEGQHKDEVIVMELFMPEGQQQHPKHGYEYDLVE